MVFFKKGIEENKKKAVVMTAFFVVRAYALIKLLSAKLDLL